MSRIHNATIQGQLSKVIECIQQKSNVNEMSHPMNYKGVPFSEKSQPFGQPKWQLSPLHLCAYYGYLTIAKTLIQAGADIHLKNKKNDKDFRTAFDIALFNKNIEFAQALKKLGAKDPKDRLSKALAHRRLKDEIWSATYHDKFEVLKGLINNHSLLQEDLKSALILTAKYNSDKCAKVLIDAGVPVSFYYSQNYFTKVTPLGIASQSGSDAVVKLLLERGAPVDEFTGISDAQAKCTPLSKALISTKLNTNVIEHLLTFGADVHKINDSGLLSLIQKNDPIVLSRLLDKGLPLDTLAKGKWVFHWALEAGADKIATLLVKRGFRVTPDDLAKSLKCPNTVQLILNQKVGLEAIKRDDIIEAKSKSIEILVKAGLRLDLLQVHDYSVKRSVFLMRTLIEKTQVNFNTLDKNGRTLLRELSMGASIEGYLENLKYILNHVKSLNVNAQSPKSGWTALHEAFAQQNCFSANELGSSRHIQAIDCLIQHGAIPIQDFCQRTPLLCLPSHRYQQQVCNAIINRYVEFEANHFGYSKEPYQQRINLLRKQHLTKNEPVYTLPFLQLQRDRATPLTLEQRLAVLNTQIKSMHHLILKRT